jgi:hypothetical protein
MITRGCSCAAPDAGSAPWSRAARRGEVLDVRDLDRLLVDQDDDEATLVIGSWGFAGAGWDTTGDAELAKAAAARAREHAQHRAQLKQATGKERRR